MDAFQIGSKLVELCRQGKNIEAIQTLYSADVVCIEARAMPGMDRAISGIDKIKAKSEMWGKNHEIHKADVKGPFPLDGRFCVIFNYDITNKQSKQRMQMEEVALYTVSSGKIVREEFFYAGG